jgi:hypothetical protein
VRRNERLLAIFWTVNIFLAIGVLTLGIYITIFHIVFKEKKDVSRLVFSGPKIYQPVVRRKTYQDFAPTWQLQMGLVGKKRRRRILAKKTIKKIKVPQERCPLQCKLKLIACAVDSNPVNSYCVLEDLRQRKQLLLGETHFIPRLKARIIKIEAQAITIEYQGKIWALKKAGLTTSNRSRVRLNTKPTTGWISQALSQAKLSEIPQGIQVNQPVELRYIGLLPGDVILQVDGQRVQKIQTLLDVFKQESGMPFWSLVLKRNEDKVLLAIPKKRSTR